MCKVAQTVQEIVSYQDKLVFDSSKPDGIARKLLEENNKIEALGWKPQYDLKVGMGDCL